MKKILLFAICSLLATRTNAQILLAQYNFDNDALDAVGNHHGTPLNGPTYTLDRFGNPNSAILLDGIDDYVNLANAAGLQVNTYTYDAWVQPTANPAGNAFCYLSIGGNGGDQLMTNVNAGADIGWNLSGYQNPGGTFDLVAGDPVILNQWYHVTGIRDVTITRLYVDGVLKDSAVIGAGTTPAYGQNLAYVGRRTPVGALGPQFFHGAVDDLKIYSGVNTPLPLDIISFTGKKENNTATLKWETANMKNVSGFEIEKSNDARSFSKIGFAAASEKEEYSFTDNLLTERNNYYRLKMMDADGKFTYSKTILVLYSHKAEINIYPNPVKDELTIFSSADNFSYGIHDMYGKEIMSGISFLHKKSISCAEMNKGIYFLKISCADEMKTLKFVKE